MNCGYGGPLQGKRMLVRVPPSSGAFPRTRHEPMRPLEDLRRWVRHSGVLIVVVGQRSFVSRRESKGVSNITDHPHFRITLNSEAERHSGRDGGSSFATFRMTNPSRNRPLFLSKLRFLAASRFGVRDKTRTLAAIAAPRRLRPPRCCYGCC